jgi:hypothetical protein
MKHTSEQYNQTKIVDVVAILGATSMVLFTLEVATRDTISAEIQQTLFAVLAILIVVAINIFNTVISLNKVNQDKLLSQDIGSVVNVYGGKYQSNTSIENSTKINGAFDFKIPENYFDVVKTIEQIPTSEDHNNVSVREVLIRLQSYIETEPSLTLEKRKLALDRVKEIAIQAIAHPDDIEIKELTALITVDSGSEVWYQIINALTMNVDISATKLILTIFSKH